MNKGTKTSVRQNRCFIKQTFAKQMFAKQMFGVGRWRFFRPITDGEQKNGNSSITGEPKKNGDFSFA